MASRPFDDNDYIGYDRCLPSHRFDSFSNFDAGSIKDFVSYLPPECSSQSYGSRDDVFVSQLLLETPSPLPIYSSDGGFSEFSAEKNRTDLDGDFRGLNGPILPPPSQMKPKLGFALREWRRLNAITLENKFRIFKPLRG